MVAVGPEEVSTHRSFCRFCEAACGIVVEVDGDQVVRVRGDADHPLTNGYTCSKGRRLPDWHHHPDRLNVPRLRDATGAIVDSDWSATLDDVAARLRSAIDEHGPDSVGIMLATGSAFDASGRRTAERMWRALKSRSVYTSASIDTPCKPLVSRLMSGFPGLVPTLDEDNASLTVLVGINPVVSHGHLNGFPDPVTKLRALATGGRELWVIDPRRTETARLATGHLALRPGTDHVLLAHLVRELLIDGADSTYLAEHAFADELTLLRELVEPFDLEYTTARCDVDAGAVADLVSAVRRHRRVSLQTGTGTTMARTANITEWLAWTLHIVTGSFDRLGGMWFNPGYLRQLDQRDLGTAGPLPAAGPPSRPELSNWLNEFPCAALADEIDSGNLRALVVFGGNPVRSLPDPDRVVRSLSALDMLAVIDVVETDTVGLASHVLPAAGQLERGDITLTIDQFVTNLSAQYTAAVVAPQADRRPAWWIFAELARRLDLSVLPSGVDASSCTDDDLLKSVVDRSRGRWDELVDVGYSVAEPVYGWVLDRVLPDRRWRLTPDLLVDQFRQLSNEQSPPLQLIPRRQMRHLNSQLADEQADEHALIVLSTSDAAARSISDGDRVVVTSAHGKIVGIARCSDDVRTGAMSIPHGFDSPNVGFLTSAHHDVDPHTGMVQQSGVAVEVEPAP